MGVFFFFCLKAAAAKEETVGEVCVIRNAFFNKNMS